MAEATAAKPKTDEISHNLLGQRLGRKGRGTRERIIAATERLLEQPIDVAISLSAVAREASLGMTTLYLYFADLTELLLALLEPVIESVEVSYAAQLRTPWDDAALGAHCVSFLQAYQDFWKKNARLLHLRNSLADAGDERMRQHRIRSSMPTIQLIVGQMEASTAVTTSAPIAMATVLLTGIERVATVNTDAHIVSDMPAAHYENILRAQARLLEMGIREARATNGKAA